MEVEKGSQKTYQYVYDYFAEQVLSGKLKINDKLPPERDVAEELGVSRNSVREVIHMMEIAGLVECVQGSGNYVRCNPLDYMVKTMYMTTTLMDIPYTEVFSIRRSNENMAFELALEAITQEELNQMFLVLLKMDETLSAVDSSRYDIEFHDILVRASHNRVLILYSNLIQELTREFIRNLRIRVFTNPTKAKELRKCHWEIYYALKTKNAEKGRVALNRHFEIVGEQAKKIEEEQSL